MTDQNGDHESGIDRRAVLQGAATGVGLVGIAGVAGAKRHGERGGPPEGGGGPPCHKTEWGGCDDEGTYVKFEFVVETDHGEIEDCYFEEETDTGLIEITCWEDKNGDEGDEAPEDADCEPVYVEWESEGYVVNSALAFGGNACDGTDDEGDDGNGFELDSQEGSYTSQLENHGDNTAAISNLQFCVEELETLELPVEDVYIGYEDRPASGDFDYNDFGMDANITETYDGGELQSVEMEFTSRVYKAGDDHLIHIQRDMPDGVEWEYTLSRSGTSDVVTGDVAAETTDPVSGSDGLDITLFDTGPLSNGDSTDATVTIDVTVTSGSVSPPTDSPRPDVAANNPLFEVYDPHMVNTSQGTRIEIETVQDNVNKGATGWDTVSDVPNVLVVPVTDFTPPGEGVTMTNLYPDFDDYYTSGGSDTDDDLDVDPAFEDWYDTS